MSRLEELKRESLSLAQELHNLQNRKSEIQNFPLIKKRLESQIKPKTKKFEPLKRERENISKEIAEKQTALETLIGLIKDDDGEEDLSAFLKEQMDNDKK